jgi:hypothetical protein
VRTAVICGLCLALAVGGLLGLAALGETFDERGRQAQSELAAITQEAVALAADLKLAREGRPAFENYRRTGLIGPAQRERWADSLITAYQSLGYAGLPVYTLAKPAAYALGGVAGGAAPGGPGADPAIPGAAVPPTAAPATASARPAQLPPGMAGAASAPGADLGPIEIHQHTLSFELADAHEEDVLAITAHLLRAHPGLQQVKGCVLSTAKPSGLNATCELRFFNLSRAAPASGPQAAPAPSIGMSASVPR